MNCTESRQWLHAYIDGELDPVNCLALERHLAGCPGCAAARRDLLALRSALRQPALFHRAPDSLRAAVSQMASEKSGLETSTRQSAGAAFSQWFWRGLAVGAMALAALIFMLRPAGISGQDEMLDEIVSGHIRSLMVNHLTDVASTDQHTVKPWFDGKLDFAPVVKDLAAQGFPLVGGRLDYLHGRSVAALVYRHNKHFINVFVWPATGLVLPPGVNERRGYLIINREAGHLDYCLVSDLNEKELAGLADLITQ